MKCEEARPGLEAYLDGELDRAAVDEIEAHLSTCAACRAELAALEQLRTALRSASRHRAPAELRARLADVAHSPVAEAPSRGALRGSWWAMAATLLLGMVLGGVFMGWRGGGRDTADAASLVARDLLASHLRALAAASPVDVVSEDRHTVKPWFAGRIGESPPVIDPKSEEFPLLGGRIDYVGERRTAVVVYGHRKHVIDVYVTAGVPGESLQMQGYALTPCRLSGQQVVIVSDIDAESLHRFSGLIGCGS